MTSNTAELACVYASLILHDDNVAITEDKLKTLIQAAGVEVEPIWMTVFARALQGKELKDLLFNFSSASSVAAAPVAAAPAAAAAAAAPAGGDKKKPAPKEESDEEMGMGLFD
jgi:large subunit ribosomal protein LP1